MSTKTEKLTFEAWLALPETKQRYEIVDGVMIMPPAPTPKHQWVAQELFVLLRNYVRGRHLGIVMMSPLDLLVQREPLRTRQPDILYLSAQRTGIRGLDDLRGMQYLDVPPDLVVEVLSPSNTRRDVESKLEDYRRVGVLECWLVSPEAETVEVVGLSGEATEVLGIYGGEAPMRSRVLDEFSLELHEIFG